MPKIIITSCMTKTFAGVHQVETDMLLLTRLAGQGLGPGPQSVDQHFAGLISRKMEQSRFNGELGEFLLIPVDRSAFPNSSQKSILLVGLGAGDKFNSKAACQAFHVIFDKALEAEVERLTIPFVAKRMTFNSLNYKGTAHILREVLEDKLCRRTRPVALQEVHLLCTPQARIHIDQGLKSKAHRECCALKS